MIINAVNILGFSFIFLYFTISLIRQLTDTFNTLSEQKLEENETLQLELLSLAISRVNKAKKKKKKKKLYLIGSNECETSYKVLKIDRTMDPDLNVVEDHTRYSKREISDLVIRIQGGNQSTGGLAKVTNAYGLLGKLYDLFINSVGVVFSIF